MAKKKAALRNRRAQYVFIGDRGNTWKTLRYYSFPPFSFFIHENKKIFILPALNQPHKPFMGIRLKAKRKKSSPLVGVGQNEEMGNRYDKVAPFENRR
ncbi:hypothetical protein UM396_02240 [Geobacillus subterraneus]|uniref:hypothetical protein n=1 Tax=Geobacillus subterraneus TaxID=129338 RepID=UPI002AC92421|nr:hypothetical protein [Geobacillus subterraneus]WPZ18789.1 hypothetical protein UM396_02240 [Geobacillus subterraneus]